MCFIRVFGRPHVVGTVGTWGRGEGFLISFDSIEICRVCPPAFCEMSRKENGSSNERDESGTAVGKGVGRAK